MRAKSNLVWIDLEMSGLDAERDVILEIASLVTDSELNVIAVGPELVIHQPDEILNNMNDWCKDQHGKSGLVNDVQQSTVTIQEAEEQTLAFIKQHCAEKRAPLCGNTVWMDRIFLHRYMPSIVDYLHYRIIDVSSVKEIVSRWYPETYVVFKKNDDHRALQDIRESVQELAYYRQTYFVQKD